MSEIDEMRTAEADERTAKDREICIYQIIQPLTIELDVFDRYRQAAIHGAEAFDEFCRQENNIPADDEDCTNDQLTILYDKHVGITVSFTTKGGHSGDLGMLWDPD